MNYSFVSKSAASVFLVGILTACGGGGSADPVAEAPPPTTFVVAGTAATGAVFDNATVTVVASDGATYPAAGEDAIVTGADGSYTITLPIEAKPPFVVQAARDDQTLVSVVAEAKDTTTNITPVTNLIASRLSTSGDPAKLAEELKGNPALFDAAALKTKVAEIVALIQPLMDAVGDSTDPLNGKFVANGTGADKLLDSLSITITPNSATSVNIAVAVKQKQAEGEQPVMITFTNTTAPTSALPAVTATDLVESGTADLIADLLKRMTACYALPQADRVSSGGTSAADIVAAACKDIFVGNDPAGYLSNGTTVNSKGAFSGIFGSGSGTTFDRGSYEFTRGNGDLVIAFRATDSSGNSANYTLPVRADTDGKLRVIGNQYKYNGTINAYHSLRAFINQTGADYYFTGYNPQVDNVLDADKNSIFEKVEVTSPKGNVFTLKPSPGSSWLPLVKNGSVTGTGIVIIRGEYVDSANSAKNPADADTSLFFSPNRLTDAEIAAIAAQGTWKFDYYLAGNTTTTPDATQYYKTRARALTIAELQTRQLAKLVDADIAEAQANSVAVGSTKLLPAPATGPVTFNWEVPDGALAPNTLQLFGRYDGKSFNDETRGIRSKDSTGTVACSAASASDNHCDSAGNYAAGTLLTGSKLWAVDPAGREFDRFYAFYTIAP